MAVEFRLPDVGEGLEEAEIVRWLVAVGDAVECDQSIVEMRTDKALVEIPAPSSGMVSRLVGDEGALVKVGDLLFVIDNGASSKVGSQKAVRAEEASTGNGGRQATEKAGGAQVARGARVKAVPSVRRLAVRKGIDLSSLSGSGPGGRIVADDVERAAETIARADGSEASPTLARPRPTAPAHQIGQAVPGRQPLRGIRRVTARTMTQAWSSIPHIHGWDEIDATALLDARSRLREGLGEEAPLLTPLPFLLLAVARALRRFPLVNASIDMDQQEIVVHEAVHLGVAVATPAGLIVPIVRDADQRSLLDVAREVSRLVVAARERSIRPEELRGGTFTVSNYGSLGGRFASPIVRPPEVGIMGFGSVRERPIVVEGVVEARPTLPICFGADHRLVDGDLSVAFQECVKDLLSDPMQLLLGE